jgi:hypothetical protein
VPALLYEPTNLEGKVPAVINLNGHDRDLGKAIPFKQRRCIALAKRGMLALSPEWFGMGELDWRIYNHGQAAGLDLCGRSSVGLHYLAVRQALDVLLEHPHADPERVALTGLSGGGWQTIVVSSLDDRVSAAVPVAGYVDIRTRVRTGKDMGDLEQAPVDLLTIADYSHLTAMLFPRAALLVFNAYDECCFAAHRARPSVYEPVRAVYDRYAPGVEFSFHENFDPGSHNYQLNNRLAFYGFLNRNFVALEDRVEGEIRSFDELRIQTAYRKRRFEELALDLAKDLPCRKKAELEGSPEARVAVRKELREVLHLRSAPVTDVLRESAEVFGDFEVMALRVRLSNLVTIPVYALTPKSSSPVGTVLLFADGGRASIADRVHEALRNGMRVLAFDVLFSGECAGPEGGAMLARTFGRRALGDQVAQVQAVAA